MKKLIIGLMMVSSIISMLNACDVIEDFSTKKAAQNWKYFGFIIDTNKLKKIYVRLITLSI